MFGDDGDTSCILCRLRNRSSGRPGADLLVVDDHSGSVGTTRSVDTDVLGLMRADKGVHHASGEPDKLLVPFLKYSHP